MDSSNSMGTELAKMTSIRKKKRENGSTSKCYDELDGYVTDGGMTHG